MINDIDLLAFATNGSIDKIVGGFDILTQSHSVAAATLSGGLYLPKTDVLTIDNPFDEKAFITMIWSINGTDFYPQLPRIYQPGNPVPTGLVGATAGAAVDDSSIYFYFVHYLGVQVDYTLHYALDYING